MGSGSNTSIPSCCQQNSPVPCSLLAAVLLREIRNCLNLQAASSSLPSPTTTPDPTRWTRSATFATMSAFDFCWGLSRGD
ncbi:hypothetical protein BRADI_1g52552v3 [Brachypodium distachyon]|uniref:Uncharacterized protein n=1 Tax=Brachypodium distachyon TaxID=15368 RepID=A0A0Q3S4K3_BRADI|nr:hypothetical protein BRADI_1g52552v3 [Brachypodium distachyon]